MRKLFVLFVLLAANAFSATHYIWSGATGSGTGADFTNAWTSISTHVSVRGDTYVLAGGTYNESPYINITLSGTTVTTLRKANASQDSAVAGWTSSLGTTQAVINGQLDIDKGYITVDGITGSGTSGHGIKVYNAAKSHVLILEDASGFSISHCEIQGAGVVDATVGYDGIEYNCVTNGARKNTYIGYNYIHEVSRNGVMATGIVGTSYSDYGLLYENNFLGETGLIADAGIHGQGMQLGQQGNMRYIILRNNTYRNIVGSGMIVFLNGASSLNHSDVQIYNNIFYQQDSGTYNIISPSVIWTEQIHSYTGLTVSNFFIANNSFYNITGGSNCSQVFLDTTGMTASNNLLENNVWEGCRLATDHSGVTQSNNGYYNDNGASTSGGLYTGSGSTNQVNGGSSTFNNAAAYDFTIKSGGYALAAGLNLTSTFTTYNDGTARANSAFDLGAGAPANPAPAVSSATIDAAGTSLTVVFSASCTTGAGGSGGMKITIAGTDYSGTYSSGSGSTTYVFTVSKVYQSATVTAAYTQPGNGIEATSGGVDVTSFSAQAVTNNSTQTLSAPTSLSAGTPNSSQIPLTWTDTNSAVAPYSVEQSLDNSNWSVVTTTAAGASSYTLSSLSAGTLYYARVRASYQGVYSSYSSTVSATTTGSGSPSNAGTLGKVIMLGNAKLL